MEINILTHGRRLHNALRHAIEDGDGRGNDPDWLEVERPQFEHHACAMYLISTLAVLEGLLEVKCWNNEGKEFTVINDFINSEKSSQRYQELEINTYKYDALHEIRNALVHNSGYLNRNRNERATEIVSSANLLGVRVDKGSSVTLISNDEVDFMEYVRVSYLCVTQYHGLW